MGELVIVAIPTADDPVWKVSSEKKPHVTLLYLGDANNPDRDQIAQFLLHAANTCLTRFMLDVDRRGELGDAKADVLFFEKMWDLPQLEDFRTLLLKDNTIRKAYDSAEQFPEWTPHLTLGYPDKPAKDNAIDHPIRYVDFDRVALWDGDYEGVELILKRQHYPTEVAMSGMGISVSEARKKMGLAAKVGMSVDDVLAHYGVKGMKWGVRKDRPATDVTVKVNPNKKRTKKKIQTKGGERLPAHEDAISPAVSKQKLKKSGPASLSNQELRELATRMQLEQQVKQLSANETSGGKKFVTKLLADTGKQQATRIVNQKASQKVDEMMAKERDKKK